MIRGGMLPQMLLMSEGVATDQHELIPSWYSCGAEPCHACRSLGRLEQALTTRLLTDAFCLLAEVYNNFVLETWLMI